MLVADLPDIVFEIPVGPVHAGLIDHVETMLRMTDHRAIYDFLQGSV